MTRRWRPSLALVLGGALAATLALSLAGMIALRYLGPVTGFRHAAIALAVVIALATAGIGWLMLRLLLQPIRALEQFAAGVEQGQDIAPPAHFGTRELHSTARRVMAMAAALRDRETTLRAYSDHVTHELKTPVAAIRAAVELIEDGGMLAPGDQEIFAQIGSAGRQIEAQLAALREMARARETRYIGTCRLDGILPGLETSWPGLHFGISGGQTGIAIAPEGMLLVLGHLVRNARDHGAGRIWLAAAPAGTGGECRITVTDNGRGISAGNAARIFDPFFTTRRETGGTGMGLAVVRAVLDAHGGQITLATPGTALPGAGRTGATFILTLPAAL